MQTTTYSGPLEYIVALVGKVEMLPDGTANISFSENAEYVQGDPWMTVESKLWGDGWPPQKGDRITVIIPKVIKVQRAKV